MILNCIIIEDEPLAMIRVKEFARKVPFLRVCQTFDNALEAIEFLRTEKIDLIFLDIQMDEFSGIQLLECLLQRPEVILTTAFDHYALKGFELQVTDYLLKPFTFERFLQAVIRVQDKLSISSSNSVYPSFLFIKTEYRLEKVLLEEILFIEGMRDYRRLHLNTRKIMTLETFKELEGQLPNHQFCRVHKSFLVSLDKIESVERDRIKIQKELIPVSGTYRESFYKKIKYSSK